MSSHGHGHSIPRVWTLSPHEIAADGTRRVGEAAALYRLAIIIAAVLAVVVAIGVTATITATTCYISH
jgi:uncharacterized protein (DUF2062 family)